MSSGESSHLPPDIMYEIFLRATKETLGRCRVASKEWNNMTYDSNFIRLHSERNNVVVGFFAPDSNVPKLDCSFTSAGDDILDRSVDFGLDVRVGLEAVSAHHGIILCKLIHRRNYKFFRFFVYKPRATLFQQIPNPRTRFENEGWGILVVRSNPFRYKILRISSPKNPFVYYGYKVFCCEVFDSDTWTWKRLQDIKLPARVYFMGWIPVVTVCGSFHWLIYPNLVFSFDMEKEEWRTHGLPFDEDDYRYITLVEYKSKLALNCVDSKRGMHTWVMEDYKNQVWTKKFVLNLEVPNVKHCNVFPVAFYGSDILVVKRYPSPLFIYWDFNNRKVWKTTKLEKHFHGFSLFPFWSDSEPSCLRGTSEFGVQRVEKGRRRRVVS